MLYIICNIKEFLRPSLKKSKKKKMFKKKVRDREKKLSFLKMSAN